MSEHDREGLSWLPDYQQIVACQTSGSEEKSAPGPVPLPPETLAGEEKYYWNDYEYLIGLLPAAARECWAASDAVLDRYEYEGSAIYMEYPDQVSVFRIADMIYETVRHYEDRDGSSCVKELAYTITCWNICFRRQRYYRRRKVFAPGRTGSMDRL